MRATFKSDSGNTVSKPKIPQLDSDNEDATTNHIQKMNSTLKSPTGGDMKDEYDFQNFTLGQGTLQDKRKTLIGFLDKLLSNKKLEAAHRKYCDNIKKKR